jgi:hypothetical protein
MAHAHHHAISSAKRFGGSADDYLPIHNFLDATKSAWADHRHRAVLHHSYGIFLTEQTIGLQEEVRLLRRLIERIPRWLRSLLRIQLPNATPVVIRTSSGREVPIRVIAEQHIIEDCGFVPSLEDYLGEMPTQSWMVRGAVKLSRLVETEGVELPALDTLRPATRSVRRAKSRPSGRVATKPDNQTIL